MKKKHLKKLPKDIRNEVKRMQKYLVEMEGFVTEAKQALDLVEETANRNEAYQLRLSQQMRHLARMSNRTPLTKDESRQYWAIEKLVIKLDDTYGSFHKDRYDTWGPAEAMDMAHRLTSSIYNNESRPAFGRINFMAELYVSSHAEEMDRLLVSWQQSEAKEASPQDSEEGLHEEG